MTFISSFDNISAVVPDPKVFLCISASGADTAAVNLNGIKTLLANGSVTVFINGNPVSNNGSGSLPRNPPDCNILDNYVFDLQLVYWLVILYVEFIASSELPVIFNDNLKITSVSFFIAAFYLLSCKFDSFTFKLLYWAILYW